MTTPGHGQRQRLEQVQRQTLRLSPLQLRFSRLLEMSAPELEEEVAAAVDENPALEVTSSPEEPTALLPPVPTIRQPSYSPDDEKWEPQQAAEAPTLAEYLDAQLADRPITDHDREIAAEIIGNIDDNGYLTRSPALIATDMAVTGADVDTPDVERVLAAVQSLDPAGVGARDLRECLLLQLRRRLTPESPQALLDALDIVERHYDKLSRMQLRPLARVTGLTDERLSEALAAIRTLNPKPGASVRPPGAGEAANTIIPDFIVERSDGGRLTVTVPSRLPGLTLSESFDLSDSPSLTPRQREAARMAAPYRDEALTLIRAIEMRHTTMLRVMQAIVRLQADFFATDDPSALRPMLLKDVAAVTGYDLSTVSRATSGKYVATDGGMFPLRMFFNDKAVESPDSDATAREVMTALRAIIASEDPRHPLSDDALAERLAADGLPVARRTVTKYRERLAIPTSRLRRRL